MATSFEEQEEELRAPYFWCYISHRGREKLPQYRYKGTDSSLVYQNLFSPTLNKLVAAGWVPRWLHPNVITIGGFLLVVFSYLLIACYSEDYTQSVPAWVCIVSAICLHLYQWLDALDGKQARHLGVGSPLGLLCDHGCDSFNATITAMNVVSVLRLGPTCYSFGLWAATTVAFFFNTWEEWFVGSLDLPLINGPNEGLLAVCGAFLWTAAFGGDWWLEESPIAGLQRNQLGCLVYMVSSLLTILGNIYKTLSAVRDLQTTGTSPKKGTPAQRQAATKRIALTRTIPLVVMVASAYVWIEWSPVRIFEKYPRILLLSLGMFCTKCCSGLMVAHLCDEPYRPFCKTMAAVTALGIQAALPPLLGHEPCNEEVLVYVLAALAVFCTAHASVSLTWEISRLLGINTCIVPAHIRNAKPKDT